MKPRWQLRELDSARVRALSRNWSVSDVTAAVVVARGHDGSSSFLDPRLAGLHDPAGLPDLERATERLALALERGERILIHGDYDVDGVTGTAILVRLLRFVGANVDWYIPNRLSDGYSFGDHSIEHALATETGLVVSVDNGTSAARTIAGLASHGIDTIVTDHHEPPPGELPAATAIVNPKLPSSTYPFRELCGSGVAFKLAWGLAQRLSGAQRVRADLRDFLMYGMAYVALATVCDVVPLVDENRILARWGLLALESAPTAGLRALVGECGLADRPLVAEDVAFRIGPRLNAAGRLGSADVAVELLLCDDEERARVLARQLDELNAERREIEGQLVEAALAAAEPFADAERWPMLVVGGDGWHQGVVGIVAARLVDRFRRPALVVGFEDGVGRGSARSVAGFDVLAAMHGGAPHMQRYGGHAAAAGCEMRAGDLAPLREAVCARARELLGGSALPEPTLWIDCELGLERMTVDLMRELDRLEPFGQENPEPVFVARDLRLAQPPRTLGRTDDHLQMVLRRGAESLRAMAFGQGDRVGELELGRPLDVVFTPRWNTFRGETRLELRVHDWRS